ncbi:hypothetical protein ASE36_17585 [Rhizobium sp. Root274]|uniref:DUF1206 domain-containing protein n=1 Tax=unclassified Rhizobium TaxID=2613769 RepID=UPI0007130E00|nr:MULTISPECIES: DUF1206 domain-containing protein [unclassified Rhizobium]KQW27425.1 hypothetical protein ASC71_17610 [Rhizobium sp. Root1240]KRD27661.1 hypothetical protein ASE36_17585 [Rhizobium sp. Root274]
MNTRSKFHLLARAGYGARGIVFLMVAGLALFSSFAGGKADTKSALTAILQQPFGRIWIALIGIGLAGFVVWRLAQSLANADGQDEDMKGYAIRAALFGSAITYAGLALTSLGMALQMSGGSGSGGEEGLAAWVMAQPFGRYLAGIIGIGFIIGGVVTAMKGIKRKFGRYLDLDAEKNSPAVLVSIYGLVARGAVFGIIGVFFVYAAFTVDPQQAGGMADALAWVHELPFGGIIYSIVALGLAAFGIYNFVEARYRRINTPEVRDVTRQLPLGRFN